MRFFDEGRKRRDGALGVVVMACVVAVGQTFNNVPMLFAEPVYYGEFSDAAGINVGDNVRVTGIDVGHVRSLKNSGDHIVLGFTLGDTIIGTGSRLAIRTETILGTRVVEVDDHGEQPLKPGGVVPLSQNTTPYQIYDAFFDVTKAAAGWDVGTVKRSLEVLSETVDQAAPHLGAALDGVARFSATIAKRDDQIKALLAKANKIARIVGDRRDHINELFLESNTILAALNQRGVAVDQLLERVAAVSQQVKGLIDDNPNLGKVIEQLRSVTELLIKHKGDLDALLSTVGSFAAAVSEAVASGPYFNVMVVNLVPGQMLQPFIDAAFKRRGIDPEKFWRDAGLPAFQFPDPNGTRSPNGAPPPSPPVVEGTPEHLGPAVPPGSPCSYTPPADGLPVAQNPLPCASLDQGPFGPVDGGYPFPGVLTEPAKPDGVPAAPGNPVAAAPGEPVPPLPGTPVPLPSAPPGARTDVPVGPPAGEPPIPSAPTSGG